MEGTIGTGLLAGRDILPNEIIVVFRNAIILQDRGLVQELTKLINTYNTDHSTRGIQYSITDRLILSPFQPIPASGLTGTGTSPPIS